MSDPWFKFYASDWLAGTRGLTAAETGVYITLVAMMYEREEAIPRDDARLSRLCGCPKASFTKAMNALIGEGKITEESGCLSNARVEKERQCRAEKSQKASASATKRWSAQAEKVQQKQQKPDAFAVGSQCEIDANTRSQKPEPDISNDTDVSLPEVLKANDLSKAVQIYNDTASQHGWPQVQKLTPQRSKSLKARIKDAGGIEGWVIAMEKAAASDFLCGRTSKPWTGFGFDWISKQSNFTKLMEGNYDNRTDSMGQPGYSDSHATTRAIDVAARARRTSQENLF